MRPYDSVCLDSRFPSMSEWITSYDVQKIATAAAKADEAKYLPGFLG